MRLINSSEKPDSLLYVVFSLLKELNIAYDKNLVEEKLKSHYSYPSVLSLNDVLKEIGLDVVTYRLDDLSLFNAISLPAISLLNDKKTFVLIKSIDKNQVQYFDVRKGLCIEQLDVFMSNWYNVITEINTVVGEKIKSCIDVKSKLSNNTFKILLSLSIFFYIFFLFYFSDGWLNTSMNVLITTTSILGCIMSLSLLNLEYQSENPYISKFCHIGRKFNCKAVAASSFSILWGNIHLYECVGLYFSGIVIYSFFSNVYVDIHSYYTLLLFVFILSLPFVVASLYQQIVVVKKYCLFCLSIDFVLVFNVFLLYNYVQTYSINLYVFYLILISFSIPLFIWYFLRNRILAVLLYKDLKIKYNRILYNPVVINSIMMKDANNYDFVRWDNEFIILKEDCDTNLILILNIACKYCAQKFLSCMDLKDDDDYPVNFVFRFWFYSDDIVARTIMKTLAASLVNNDREKASNDLVHWYKCFLIEDSLEQAFKLWQKNVNWSNIDINEIQIDKYLNLNLGWYKQMGFTGTPIEILNGKIVPNDIEIRYLKYSLISEE